MATAPTTGDAAETRSNADELRADDERADELRADDERADDERADDERADELRADDERADDERADELRADDERADDAAGGSRRRGWRAWRRRREGTHVRAGGPGIWRGWSLGRKDTSARAWRPRRRIGLIDVLRVLGLARRAVPRPVVGPRAYPQWWQRMLALLVLAAVVVGIGFALAALVGLMVVVAGFLLEQAIS